MQVSEETLSDKNHLTGYTYIYGSVIFILDHFFFTQKRFPIVFVRLLIFHARIL